MLQGSGDIHHILPKDYLQENGFPDRGDYSQVANYALAETSINVSIGNRAPADYMAKVRDQIESGVLVLGELIDTSDLHKNLAENAVPSFLPSVTAGSYAEFLAERRGLMAATIRKHYEML